MTCSLLQLKRPLPTAFIAAVEGYLKLRMQEVAKANQDALFLAKRCHRLLQEERPLLEEYLILQQYAAAIEPIIEKVPWDNPLLKAVITSKPSKWSIPDLPFFAFEGRTFFLDLIAVIYDLVAVSFQLSRACQDVESRLAWLLEALNYSELSEPLFKKHDKYRNTVSPDISEAGFAFARVCLLGVLANDLGALSLSRFQRTGEETDLLEYTTWTRTSAARFELALAAVDDETLREAIPYRVTLSCFRASKVAVCEMLARLIEVALERDRPGYAASLLRQLDSLIVESRCELGKLLGYYFQETKDLVADPLAHVVTLFESLRARCTSEPQENVILSGRVDEMILAEARRFLDDRPVSLPEPLVWLDDKKSFRPIAFSTFDAGTFVLEDEESCDAPSTSISLHSEVSHSTRIGNMSLKEPSIDLSLLCADPLVGQTSEALPTSKAIMNCDELVLIPGNTLLVGADALYPSKLIPPINLEEESDSTSDNREMLLDEQSPVVDAGSDPTPLPELIPELDPTLTTDVAGIRDSSSPRPLEPGHKYVPVPGFEPEGKAEVEAENILEPEPETELMPVPDPELEDPLPDTRFDIPDERSDDMGLEDILESMGGAESPYAQSTQPLQASAYQYHPTVESIGTLPPDVDLVDSLDVALNLRPTTPPVVKTFENLGRSVESVADLVLDNSPTNVSDIVNSMQSLQNEGSFASPTAQVHPASAYRQSPQELSLYDGAHDSDSRVTLSMMTINLHSQVDEQALSRFLASSQSTVESSTLLRSRRPIRYRRRAQIFYNAAERILALVLVFILVVGTLLLM
ncbi:hypothetical protein GMRT_10131 [Giardia muris]|uniref:Uncharacterized protein n=1 Tax=Giardia muris TaxID=5742 RepID=A0A4Z1T5M8_GIAMU|nr:hypothetical protein GMRT_10131 [Giardia muris]|eukprot:TNJ27781.1 hypothetical protein GMRT_10131 [Giardia muris]